MRDIIYKKEKNRSFERLFLLVSNLIEGGLRLP